MLWPVRKFIPGVSDGDGGGGAGDQGPPLNHGQGSDGTPTGGGLSVPRPEKLGPDEVHIRWKMHRDNEDLARIEQRSWDRPWTEEDFLRSSRQRNIASFVAQRNNSIVGFVIYELHSNSFHIVNFAVDPSVRRIGIGTMMINHLFKILPHHERTEISLTVREGNLPAQLFLRGCGFKADHVIRGFFKDTDEDGYCMVYRLPEEP